MLNEKIISNFIGIRNVSVNKIREKNKFIKIYLSTAKSIQVCPCCKSNVYRIHDYRKQTIKHSSYRGKQVLLVLNKRRYKEISWLFTSAEIVVDRYHYVRQIYFALNTVRKYILLCFGKR